MEQLTKGCCVDCGFNSVCDEVNQNKRKCNEYYYTKWIAEEMEKRKLRPSSEKDKKYFLKLRREKTAENARDSLSNMIIIVVALLIAAVVITVGLWLPIVLDLITSACLWAATYNINLGATMLIILGSLLGMWIVSNVISSVLVLHRHHIREEKGTFKDIQPSTTYEVVCECGNVIVFDDEILRKGSTVCVKCGEVLEFDLEED